MVNLDLNKLLLTEDYFVNWVKSRGGVAYTRKYSNINVVKLSECPLNTLVCLTGYPHLVNQFFKNVIKKFTKKIILITLETDGFTMKREWLDHPLVSHWFTWNKQYDHPKLTCIPIGLNHDRHLNSLKNFLTNSGTIERDKFFAVNLTVSTNPARQSLINLAKTKWSSFCTFIDNIPFVKTHWQPSHIERVIKIDITDPKCYSILSQYKFILSPYGAGLDCHRTWEALYSGTIPIVLFSSIDELFEDLPVVIVSDWNQITKNFLEKKYEEIQRKLQNNEYNMDKLYFDYWKNLINNKIKDIEL